MTPQDTDSKRFFTISVDTESDWFDWKTNKISSVPGIHYLQELCEKYDMVPTYLITYEIASNDLAIRVIKEYLDRSECEVGHHLHVWSNPPFVDPNRYGVDEKWYPGIQSELDDSMLYEKMANLDRIIEDNFGVKARSHRSGRLGVDERTIEWLSKNGYYVDSSISPFVSSIHVKGVNEYIVTDSKSAPNYPYYPDIKDITKESGSEKEGFDILEVPITGIKGDILSNIKVRGMGRLRNLLHRIGYTGMFNSSFRPSNDMPLSVYKRFVHKIFNSELRFFNFMFHSTELTEGTSPYSKNKDLLDRLRERLEFTVKTAKDFGLIGLPLYKVRDYF